MGKISIDRDGDWTKYITDPPTNVEMMGVVTFDGQEGALGYFTEFRIYVQMTNEGLRSLPQNDVENVIRMQEHDILTEFLRNQRK